MADDGAVLWGSLAAEAYLVAKWDDLLKECPEQQRSRIIQKYLDSDIPREWTVATTRLEPTAMQIDTILRPWRPDKLRRQAQFIFTEETPIVLRTHYQPEDEEKFRNWITEPLTSRRIPWWAFLDDKNFYDFGADWRRVYNVMPEIAGPMGGQSRRSPDHREINYFRKEFKRNLRRQGIWEPKINEDIALRLQRVVTATYILIADQEAFDTGCLWLLYLDCYRNIVREAHINAEKVGISEVILHWEQTMELWEQSDVGEKYRLGGELGEGRYELNEEGPDASFNMSG
ncbi:uncharacterized protein N7469_001916 [Penicillium citrinum]|uniref:Uncharacterized protein n=1 Tax=Penicillium citrinum TaxID=5077 RepID=A0A9W9TT09_PENCI|nr:uncharacterized protein N7469_001916 [Penicillium citrinum]KAJ5240325.1 hypothetical protein N7469_001916 [Penicillium citrinum]